MKIVRYESNQSVTYGVLEQNTSIVKELYGDPFAKIEFSGKEIDMNEIKIVSPVVPSKIICVGLNYQQHIKEMNLTNPTRPMIFMKPASSLIGLGDSIIYPKNASRVEYEGELVVVMGKTGRNISEENALEYVFGYTCGNDVTERVIQKEEMSSGALLISKGFDTFCSLGPLIATEINPDNTNLITKHNGIIKQETNTSDLLFSVRSLIAYLSSCMTLIPGDVILTGTPSGVGPLVVGDRIEVEIEGIGNLHNVVLSEE